MSVTDIAAKAAADALIPPVDPLAAIEVPLPTQVRVQSERLSSKENVSTFAALGGVATGVGLAFMVWGGRRRKKDSP